MEFRQIRYFEAVARTLSFSRAAEVLNVAQPALSRQIQQLEDEFGVLLIDRSFRPLKLTNAGAFPVRPIGPDPRATGGSPPRSNGSARAGTVDGRRLHAVAPLWRAAEGAEDFFGRPPGDRGDDGGAHVHPAGGCAQDGANRRRSRPVGDRGRQAGEPPLAEEALVAAVPNPGRTCRDRRDRARRLWRARRSFSILRRRNRVSRRKFSTI